MAREKVSARKRLELLRNPPSQWSNQRHDDVMLLVRHIHKDIHPIKYKEDLDALYNNDSKEWNYILDLLDENQITWDRIIAAVQVPVGFLTKDIPFKTPPGMSHSGGIVLEHYTGCCTKVRMRQIESGKIDEVCIAEESMVFYAKEQVLSAARDPANPDAPAQRVGTPRMSLFGQPVTAVIRWMGVNEWTFPMAKKALQEGLLIPVSDSTIRCQLRGAIDGSRGDPAKLTKEQAEKLNKCLE